MRTIALVAALPLLALGGASAAWAQEEPVELEATIGNWIDPSSPRTDPVLRELFERFAEEHPNISIDWNPQGYTELEQQLLTAAAAGDLPDFAFVDSIWVQRLASLGALQPLDALWPAEDRADYKAPFLEGATYDGQLYAMWDSTDTRVLWYDRQAFEEAGLDPDQPPRTWEELTAAAQQLTDGQRYGLGLALAPHEYVVADVLLPMFWGLGGSLLDEAGAPAFGEGENRAAMIEAFNYLKSLQDAGVIPPDALQLSGESALYPGMATGRYAMVIGNNILRDAALQPLAPDSAQNWEAAVLPAPRGGEPSSMNGGFTWGIFTDDPAKQQAAWEFISFWNSPEVQLARFQPTAQVPVRASTAEDPFYQSEFWQTVNEAAGVGQTRPGVAIYPVMSQQLQQAVQAFMTGGATAEEAIDAAAAAVAAEHERQQQR